jgi:cystathionine beta-lyase/cystathionine gamma-synthase
LDPCLRRIRSDLVGIAINPLLVVAELDTICAAPRKPRNLGVDNTFATPLNQRPAGAGR